MELNRRQALSLVTSLPLAFAITPEEAAYAASQVAQAKPYTLRFFTPTEYATIVALSDLIIPRDARSASASEAGAPEFIDYIVAEQPARQTAMRGGLAWIHSMCTKRFGHDFVACTEAERTALLDEIAYFKGHDEEEEEAEMREPRSLLVHIHHGPSFFNSFRDLTASGFWSSEMGIEDLGYRGNTFVAEWTGGAPQEVLVRLGVAKG